MNAYSKDLRLKTLSAIDRGIPRREIQELFGVSRSTIKRWLKRRRQTGDVDIHKIPGRPSVKGEAFSEESGAEVSKATMSRNIARLPGEWPLKKSKVAQERDEGARTLWRWS